MSLIGLSSSAVPDLFDGTSIESLTGTDKTAYLNIDLDIDPLGEKPVPPMTAVFAPDPSQLSGDVDVLLWFHGDKSYWNVDHSEERDFTGKPIQVYLKELKLCNLRDFIIRSGKRKFILVAPTLNDHTGKSLSGNGKRDDPDAGRPAALIWDQDDAGAYLQQCVNAVNKHMGAHVTGVGRIVLAAHSGGGHLQAQMAQEFSGKFERMNEVWCFDSSYWGSKPLIEWVKKGRSNQKLFVFATANELTSKYASQILNATLNPQGFRMVLAVQTTQIDVLINRPDLDPRSTPNALATYGGIERGHYEGMQRYLPKLVQNSGNLQ